MSVALVTASEDFERRVRHAFQGPLDLLKPGAPDARPADIVAQLDDSRAPEVVLLGPGFAPGAALSLAAGFDRDYPGTSVVLVAEPGPDSVLEAMRAGVRDVLQPDAEFADIRLVLDRAGQSAADRHRPDVPGAVGPTGGRVITIVSPKGGVGKTTLSTNIAVGLARQAPHAVVLLDLDLQFGDAASGLQLSCEYTISDAIQGPTAQDAMLLKTFLSTHPSGLYVLCAPHSPAAADAITGEQIGQLVDLLAQGFRYVVIDTGPGLTEPTLAALDRTTDMVALTGPDVPGVRGLRKEFDVLAELGMTRARRHVVLNFADAQDGLTASDVAATIGTAVDVAVPRSRAVPASTNRGTPLLAQDGREPATRALQQLVGRLSMEPARRSGRSLIRLPRREPREQRAPEQVHSAGRHRS